MRNPTVETPTNRGERVKRCPNEIRAYMYDPSVLPSFLPSFLPCFLFYVFYCARGSNTDGAAPRSSPCVTPVDPGERIKRYMDKPKISTYRKFAGML